MNPGAARLGQIATWILVAAAAVGGALAGCHPTGTPVVDPVYGAVIGAGIVAAASQASRPTLLVLAAVALAMSRGWLDLPAGAALLLAFASTFGRRTPPWLGAAVGALAGQTMLRWPSVGFHGLTALVALAAASPCVISGGSHLPERVQRVILGVIATIVPVAIVLSVPAVVAAVQAHTDITRGTTAAESALSSVSSGGVNTGSQELRQASVDFAAAHHTTDPWWTLGARVVPVVAQQRQAVVQATEVAGQISSVAAAQAAGINFEDLRYQGGGVNLSQLAKVRGPITVVADQLTVAVHQLAGLRSPWLVSPLRSRLDKLDADVARAQRSSTLAAQIVRAAPALLGGSGARHYFVAFSDPSESRGLGGLIASYAILSVDRGRISLAHAADVSQLNTALAAHGGGHISGPADYLARYGAFHPQDYFQDLSYSPDLPTDTQVVAQMYREATGQSIDGMLVVDPQGLAALLSLTGPIQSPGLGVIDSANAAAELLKGQYAQFPSDSQQTLRRTYLEDALGLTFAKLTGGSLPDPKSMSSALDPAVREGHLLLWSVHAADQPLLSHLGLAGAFPTAGGGDLLAVVSQNAANNKIDPYLSRSVLDRVRYDPGSGQVESEVTITLHNSAPASGLADEVIGSYPGSGLRPGTNRIWLSLYSPLALGAATLDGQPLPITWVPELGVETYSGYVNLGPGATATVGFRLQGRIAPSSAYRLVYEQAPEAGPNTVTVDVVGVPGWRLRSASSWRTGLERVEPRVFAFSRQG